MYMFLRWLAWFIWKYMCVYVCGHAADWPAVWSAPSSQCTQFKMSETSVEFYWQQKLYKNVLPVALTEYFYWKSWSLKGNLDFKSPPKPQLPSIMILCSIHLTPSGINNAPVLLSYYHLTHWYFKHSFTHTGIRHLSTVCLQYNDSVPLDKLVKGIWQKKPHNNSDLAVKGPHVPVTVYLLDCIKKKKYVYLLPVQASFAV